MGKQMLNSIPVVAAMDLEAEQHGWRGTSNSQKEFKSYKYRMLTDCAIGAPRNSNQTSLWRRT